MIRIADNLSFPDAAVTQTFGILAVRGSGKSNTAAVMAEQMWAAGLPFVVVDPVGAWWGLRSATDGKSPGLPIPIFGGRHGDVPLERGVGVMIADLVVDKRLSCVLDCSEFSEGDKIHFLIDFAERLYRRNQDPLHLFLEEADDYAPQRPFREQARLLRSWENVVRRGRARGLGITMITQRSAALNKNVLTQIETLIVLRTTAPNDRKAIESWVEYHGQSRELLESLPGLQNGEAWVWSPSWMKILRRVKVHKRMTFDSGATPRDIRGKRAPATLADVDLEAIKKNMAATIERAKAEDPRELRRRIAELERELNLAKRLTPAKVEPKIVKVPVLSEEDLAKLNTLRESIILHGREFLDTAERTTDVLKELTMRVVQGSPPILKQSWKPPAPNRPTLSHSGPRSQPVRYTGIGPVKPCAEGITPAKQKILNGLAFLHGIGIATASKAQLALIAGASPTSGGYFNNLGSLRSAGLIDYPAGGTVALTAAGQRVANTNGVPRSTEELHEVIRSRLPPAKWKIVEALIQAYPNMLTKDALADQIGASPTSGGYFNNLGSLRSSGLIKYPEPGMVRAQDILFL